MTVSTFLFLWDPARWHWPAELRTRIEQEGAARAAWSTGARRTGFASGDRALLFKVNHGERGIVASGRIAAEQPEDPDAERTCRRTFVDIEWDALVELDDVLGRAELRAITPGRSWLMQAGGTRLPDDQAVLVEQAWSEHPPVQAGARRAASRRPEVVDRE